MDILLSRVTQHAMNYAIRSGVTIATGYTIKQCGRLLQQTPKSQEREEILHLQSRLESKIRIISPAIDMIDLISARGHTSLECAVSLTKEIRLGIQSLGTQLRAAAEEQDLIDRKSKRAKGHDESQIALYRIIREMKALIAKIDDAVPLVNLAITTSGMNLSTKLSANVSPSRLLQASTFLTAADTAYVMNVGQQIQVGPTFVVSLYMLFAGHAARAVDEAGIRDTTWKEVLHKAHVKLVRLPLDQCGQLYRSDQKVDKNTFRESTKSAEFAYQLVIIEDLDDDRVHTFEAGEEPTSFDSIQEAGIRCAIPVHEISKLFYADTGKILNIRGEDEDNTPILLLKRDVNAIPPRRMVPRSPDLVTRSYDGNGVIPSSPPAQDPISTWSLPADLDLEWMALEVFTTPADSDDESYDDDDPKKRTSDSSLNALFSALSFGGANSPLSTQGPTAQTQIAQLQTNQDAGIMTSLSLLEMLIKLTALQQFRQESHLAIEDELLNFFLEESATAGAGGDKNRRQRVRQHAIQKVGFDPYDESPTKRRGEAYSQNVRPENKIVSMPLLLESPERRSLPASLSGTPKDADTSDLHLSASPYSDVPALKHRTPYLTPAASDLIDRSPSPLLLNDSAHLRQEIQNDRSS
ncbi:hypothetical protein AMS68_007427 [Peltaster fructicola]|uniref:Ran-binding-domain-containing protein n=1 Tax=Peltaster fructicola TaxID=286661 RepID=A0A6H0Y5N9_9PEZI|nr:hypothetical protein AMS68_007427 [Peltaster fructicola]